MEKFAQRVNGSPFFRRHFPKWNVCQVSIFIGGYKHITLNDDDSYPLDVRLFGFGYWVMGRLEG